MPDRFEKTQRAGELACGYQPQLMAYRARTNEAFVASHTKLPITDTSIADTRQRTETSSHRFGPTFREPESDAMYSYVITSIRESSLSVLALHGMTYVKAERAG